MPQPRGGAFRVAWGRLDCGLIFLCDQVFAKTVARAACCGTSPVLVSIHSFTKCWRGRCRPVETRQLEPT